MNLQGTKPHGLLDSEEGPDWLTCLHPLNLAPTAQDQEAAVICLLHDSGGVIWQCDPHTVAAVPLKTPQQLPQGAACSPPLPLISC